MGMKSFDDLAKQIEDVQKIHDVMNKLVEYIQKTKKKKGQTLLEDVAIRQQEMMSYGKLVTDRSNVFSDLIDPVRRGEKVKAITDSYMKFNKEQLVDKLVRARFLIEGYELRIKTQDQRIECLNKFYDEHQKGRLEKSKRKQAGKEKIYKSNNDCLKDCYDEFVNSLGREIRNSDYASYKRYLLKQYPIPPFVPKPKLTKEEKRQPKELQDADRASKEREGSSKWVDSTVRNAFFKYSKLKPTTLKK